MKTKTKLTKEDVLEIRRRRSEGEKLVSIAASYPYSLNYIWQISRGNGPKKLFYENK